MMDKMETERMKWMDWMNWMDPEDMMSRLVHHGKWNEVVDLYEKSPELRDRPLSATNETTLHMAIMAGNKDAVMMLLGVLNKNANRRIVVRDILTRKNDDGVTPIHLAATLGMDEACLEMARLCPDLVTQVRNKDGETPLFTAVRHGKKEAFFALEHHRRNKDGNNITHCRRNDGNNITHCRRDKDGNSILHIAIYGEYFDLAYEIVYLYPSLINYVNMRGESPLHYLANKPSSFRSGISFNLFHQVIYSCIPTEPIKTNFHEYKSRAYAHDNPILPETCNAISQIFTSIKPIFENASIIPKCCGKEQTKNDEENSGGGQQKSSEEEKKWLPFQKIYEVGVFLFKIVMTLLFLVIGLKTQTLQKMKRKHNHAYQLMNELVQRSKKYKWEYEKNDGMDPRSLRPSSGSDAPPNEPPLHDSSRSNATPVLVAVKNGIIEMVEKILDTFPVAVLDVDKDGKNILLLAVEYRQSHIYEFMNERKIMNNSVFRKVDENGNSALHLAGKLSQGIRLSMPGVVPQLQWEIQWFKHVMDFGNRDFFATYNCDGKTAQHIFTEEHKVLVDEAGKWMSSTSNSCSVIAALIAGVSFNSIATVPGGPNQISGVPILFDKSPFQVFAFSSLLSFCCSVSSLIIFLTIISSRFREQDFERTLPAKLIIGLSSLFTAIVALLVSFGAGNFFVVNKELNYVAFAIYALTFFPIIIYAIQHFPLYVDFLWATLTPQGIPKKQAFWQN